MSGFDHFDLDGHLLRVLLTVHEERSVTRAAQRLEVTQSAVSHALDKLRAIVGDALFVKSGRGIVATATAEALAVRARVLLDELRAFSQSAGFDATRLGACFTIAANDLQRDLLLPRLLHRLRETAPAVTLRVIPSGAPEPAMLREEHCDLIVTPRPPAGADIVHKRLFDDRYAVFFDAGQRAAPASRGDYLAAEHVTVQYESRRALEIDDWLGARGVQRRIVATVPSLAAVASMLRGSPWLATVPSLLARGALRDLASADAPFETPPMPMYMVWHQRHDADAVHRWLRERLLEVVGEVMAAPAD